MFQFVLLDNSVLEVTVEGLLTLDEAECYVAEMREHVDMMRRRQGYSLVIVDGRNSAVQPQYVMEKMATLQSILVTTDRDRAAYIVVSSLAKLQAQRLSTTDQLKVFLSASAARTWLLAYHTDQNMLTQSDGAETRPSH